MKRFLLILAIIPALILGLLVWRYSVDIPFWDQWDTPGKLIVESFQEKLTWQQWWRQHNESRPLFPNFIFLTLANLTNWNNRAETAVTFILACSVSFNIYCLSRRTFGDRWQHLWCFILANLLIFSPLQQENWSWGFQGVFFTSILAITTSLLVIFSTTPWIVKLTVSSALSLFATLSFANGILCWLVLFPVLLVKSIQDKINKTKIVFFWVAAFSVTLLLYFYDFHRLGDNPSVTQIFTKPHISSRYFLTLLGSPLLHPNFGRSEINFIGIQLAGGFLLFAFVIFSIYLWYERHNTQLIDRSLLWLPICFYVFLSGGLITAGRMGLGIESSLAQRYITVTTYLIIALIYLFNLILNQISPKIVRGIIIFILLFFFFIIYENNFITGVKWFSHTHYHRLYGKACVMMLDIVRDDPCISQKVYPVPEALEIQARKINENGMLKPGILTKIDWQTPLGTSEFGGNIYGAIDNLKFNKNGEYIISGWALALAQNPSFDAIVLAYQTDSRSPQAFAIADLIPDYNKLGQLLLVPQKTKITWQKTIPASAISPLSSKVTAWALDTDDGKAYPLASNY